MKRRAVLGAMLASALASVLPTHPAAAATYEVLACGGGPNLSWTPSASAGMTVSPGCSADGLVAQNASAGAGATVPAGSAARWRFDAPTGTTITGITLDAGYATGDAGWQAALSNGTEIVQGCRAGSAPCLSTSKQAYGLPPSQAIYTEAFCTSGSCPASDLRASVALHSASVRLSDTGEPSIDDPGGPAWAGDWIGSTSAASFNARDASGITAVAAAVDGKQVSYQSRACNQYAKRCDDWNGAQVDVNVRGLEDGQHSLALKAVDRAGLEGAKTRTVGVDNTPPSLPQGLALVGTGTWRPGATAQLAWTNPAQAFAPIVGARFQACAVGTDECVVGDDDSPTGLDLTLPHPGLYDVRVWLRDAAGNADKQNATAPIQVGWDADAPTDVAFAPIDPANPAAIRVTGKDATSGIAGGRIEYRRKGAKAWRSIKTAPAGDGITATMPDGRLRDGRYQLRATVADAAGNARVTMLRTTGKRAGVTLPLRIKARLTVGRQRVVRVRVRNGRRAKRVRFDAAPRVRVRRTARLSGRLVAPGGNPLAGAAIDVTAQAAAPGAPRVPVARLTTGRRGRFSYKSPPGPSRIVRFSYAGAAKIRPQLRRVRVRVPAESTISASRRRVVNGEPVRFTGRVTTKPLPATGKLVELQFFDRGRWRTFRTAHTNAKGVWRYTYRFTGTVGRRAYRFRVHMPRESGYTYADGGSRPVRVTVQGL